MPGADTGVSRCVYWLTVVCMCGGFYTRVRDWLLFALWHGAFCRHGVRLGVGCLGLVGLGGFVDHDCGAAWVGCLGGLVSGWAWG